MIASTRSALLFAIDQGTTNTKGLLIDRTGRPVFRTSHPICLRTPEPGFVEQNPCELWSSVERTMQEAVGFARSAGQRIAAIALSNQRETAIAWNRCTGHPLGEAMSWQCRRSTAICTRLAGHADRIRQIAGLPLDPVLTATKWMWALENNPAVGQAAQRGELCLGTVDTWLVWKLSGGRAYVTDHTNASRTGLFDLERFNWSEDLLDLFGIPASAMPDLRPSSSQHGTCASFSPLDGVPILAAIGDSHAALAGHGDFAPGAIKSTYGTGSSLMLLTNSLPENTLELSRTVAWSTECQVHFALEGNVFMTGSALQWVGEFLGLPCPTDDALALAEHVIHSAGLYFVPAMVGLGAPYWNTKARGLLCGLERTHIAAHMARAAVEAIAFQIADVFFAMQAASRSKLCALRTDGGASRNNSLMQFQADLLGLPVLRSAAEELSAFGAAYLAGEALGWWTQPDEMIGRPGSGQTFVPVSGDVERRQLYAGWKDAVARALLQSREATL